MCSWLFLTFHQTTAHIFTITTTSPSAFELGMSSIIPEAEKIFESENCPELDLDGMHGKTRINFCQLCIVCIIIGYKPGSIKKEPLVLEPLLGLFHEYLKENLAKSNCHCQNNFNVVWSHSAPGKTFLRVLLHLAMHDYKPLVSGALQLLLRHFAQRQEVLHAFKQVRVVESLIQNKMCLFKKSTLDLIIWMVCLLYPSLVLMPSVTTPPYAINNHPLRYNYWCHSWTLRTTPK